MDSTVISTQSRASMHDWLFNKVAEDYAMSSDWDTAGAPAGRSMKCWKKLTCPRMGVEGIERFVAERSKRLGQLQASLDQAKA